MSNFYNKVYNITSQIPLGKVTSYGRIAAILGSPRAARAVGYALNSLKEGSIDTIPWQRVINSQGMISIKGDHLRASLQRELLEQEGIEFDENNRIDWKKFGWP